jgi:DNA-binding beta-propeller fold protein YncE
MLVDSAPFEGYWGSVHLGHGRWLFSGKHRAWLWDGTNSDTLGDFEQPEQLEVSPDGSRIFPELGYVGGGAPVYDAARGVIAYRLPLFYTGGVGFSTTGDTAYVVGVAPPAWSDSVVILAIDPLTGTVFREGRLPGGEGLPGLMAIDPVQPWLYVAYDAPYPFLRVIDRRTLAQVAVLRAPVATPPGYYGYLMLPVLSPAERRLYVVDVMNWNAPASVPSYVYVFDLMP